MSRTVSIIVKGKVQGVFYRQSTKEKADSLNITGQVKNERDGSVSIIATGSSGAIDELIAWCHIGPRRAIVSEVKTSEIEEKKYEDFSII